MPLTPPVLLSPEDQVIVFKRWILEEHLRPRLLKALVWMNGDVKQPVKVSHKLSKEVFAALFGRSDDFVLQDDYVEKLGGPLSVVKRHRAGCWSQIVPPVYVSVSRIIFCFESYTQDGDRQPRAQTIPVRIFFADANLLFLCIYVFIILRGGGDILLGLMVH